MRSGVRLALALAAGVAAWADSPPAGSKVCAGCHAQIWQAYQRTGMARSFYTPDPAHTIEDYGRRNFYNHAASGIRYEMIHLRDAAGDHYFQRQSTIGFHGEEANVLNSSIDFVMGSGNHARTYLHRTVRGTLQQLPLSWYAENGGEWAMSPGYDRPDHQGVQREVTYDCIFCHNAYPGIPASSGPRAGPVFSSIPQGIDCQRCHGGGEKHVALARAGAHIEQIRSAILNPSRLSSERQMEVCAQCHLETTSSPLPGSMVRYERGPFSYRPGEPLDDFMLHFDHAPGTGRDDKFEISGSVYRLRQSQCFRKSNGALGCTTCHDPHNALSGADAARHYASVCRKCHAAAFDRQIASGAHTSSSDCVGCHMPKRRTDDVVHVVMTDHLIQRHKPAVDLLAARPEVPVDGNPYRGEVVRYDLAPHSARRPGDELYLAIAQVSQQSNLSAGIARLEAAIVHDRPTDTEYDLQLADALANARRFADAAPVYKRAIDRDPHSAAAPERMALCLSQLGNAAGAETAMKRAVEIAPNATRWVLLGEIRAQGGKLPEALKAFETAIKLDPQMPDAFATAGAIAFELGDTAHAETALRRAILLHPNHPAAHNNLGNLLAESNRFEEARFHFEAALHIQPDYAGARYDYALALIRVRKFDEARAQLESILKRGDSPASGSGTTIRERARSLIEQMPK
jgi:predicted CXXCH cytochrome family protein